MADYKQMYLTLLDATEKAMELLIEAQQKCEELYVKNAGNQQGFVLEILQSNIHNKKE